MVNSWTFVLAFVPLTDIPEGTTTEGREREAEEAEGVSHSISSHGRSILWYGLTIFRYSLSKSLSSNSTKEREGRRNGYTSFFNFAERVFPSIARRSN
jgi:hypothetical protein